MLNALSFFSPRALFLEDNELWKLDFFMFDFCIITITIITNLFSVFVGSFFLFDWWRISFILLVCRPSLRFVVSLIQSFASSAVAVDPFLITCFHFLLSSEFSWIMMMMIIFSSAPLALRLVVSRNVVFIVSYSNLLKNDVQKFGENKNPPSPKKIIKKRNQKQNKKKTHTKTKNKRRKICVSHWFDYFVHDTTPRHVLLYLRHFLHFKVENIIKQITKKLY